MHLRSLCMNKYFNITPKNDASDLLGKEKKAFLIFLLKKTFLVKNNWFFRVLQEAKVVPSRLRMRLNRNGSEWMCLGNNGAYSLKVKENQKPFVHLCCLGVDRNVSRAWTACLHKCSDFHVLGPALLLSFHSYFFLNKEGLCLAEEMSV